MLAIKRIFDFVISLIFLIVLLPILLIISIAIKIDSKGSILFKQSRGGYLGKHFKIYKFRTMVENAEKIGLGYRTSKDDPRITRVGKFLRKTSLDELPQLINVLKGEMSLVGPRPALTVQTDGYNEYQKKRLEMRPGITGYAQVNGRNNLSWDEKIELDIYYIDNFSIWLDIKILFSTFKTIFNTEQIYR